MSATAIGPMQRLSQWLGQLGTPDGDVLPVRLGTTRLSSTGAAPITSPGIFFEI